MKLRTLKSVSRSSRRAAFTLMEMMVVVAIIVALAGLGIVYMAGQVDEGNKARAKADVKDLTSAVTMFKVQHPETGWPQSLQQLMQRDDQGHGPYLTSMEKLMDPWGNPYVYDMNGQNNQGLQPDIYCNLPGGQGKIANWSNKIVH